MRVDVTVEATVVIAAGERFPAPHELASIAATAGEMAKHAATEKVKQRLSMVDDAAPDPVNTVGPDPDHHLNAAAPQPTLGPSRLKIFSDRERITPSGLRDDGIVLDVRQFTITADGGLELTIDPEEQRRWANALIKRWGLEHMLVERPEYGW